MLVADDRRAGEPAAVNDRGVVQLVGKDQILFADQGRDGGQIGIESRLERNRGFHALETGQFFFELRMKDHGSGNGADRRRADTETLDRVLGRLLQLRMVGQTEIIVGAEVQHPLAVHVNPGALGRFDRPQVDQQSFLFQAAPAHPE